MAHVPETAESSELHGFPMVAACVLAALLTCSGTLAAQEVVYYHLDAIGSVRAVTNQSGSVIERHDYLPFGEECTSGPCAANPVNLGPQPRRFTGKERDTETGLDYFGARYYGAHIGRFTTPDPSYTLKSNLVEPQRWNRYAYGKNNPLRFVDPDGRETIIVHGTWAKSESWPREGSEFNKAVSRTFGETALAFQWSGSNRRGPREKAALELRAFVEAHHVEGEALNIVAHSHGGNIVKEYTTLPGSRKVDVLVNLGTPQRSDYAIQHEKVGTYLNAYDPWDGVQTNGGWLGFKAGRTDPLAVNIPIRSGLSGVDAHSFLHTSQAWSALTKASDLPK